jgi:hypothetical protein
LDTKSNYQYDKGREGRGREGRKDGRKREWEGRKEGRVDYKDEWPTV